MKTIFTLKFATFLWRQQLTVYLHCLMHHNLSLTYLRWNIIYSMVKFSLLHESMYVAIAIDGSLDMD